MATLLVVAVAAVVDDVVVVAVVVGCSIFKTKNAFPERLLVPEIYLILSETRDGSVSLFATNSIVGGSIFFALQPIFELFAQVMPFRASFSAVHPLFYASVDQLFLC